MPSTTVRIRKETREALRELERETGIPTSELLARAVERFRRSVILGKTNTAYGALRADPDTGPNCGSSATNGPRRSSTASKATRT